MDFGVVDLDGLEGSDHEAKQQWLGSGFLKQERSDITDQDDLKSSKLLKIESLLLPQRNPSLKSNITSLSSDCHHQILNFSCPKSESFSSPARTSQSDAALPGFYITSSGHCRSTGLNHGTFNVRGYFAEARGPFTSSQWMELEHQALIYKYITANVPIPPNLLIPIRKALDSVGFSSFSGGFLRPSALPWGAFHLGFSSNNDPEPGRCRRTDGKKWRCSRDAVADQKYCERHMNRGRHRSRKHVEGQSGHSAAAAISTTNAKPLPATSLSSVSVAGFHGSALSDNISIAQKQQQLSNSQPDSSSNLSAATPLNRMFLNKENSGEKLQDTPSLSMVPSKIDLKSKDNYFVTSKQHNPYQESSQVEFGYVTSDSLLNPLQSSCSSIGCKSFGSSQHVTDQETVSPHSSHQFLNCWPKSQCDQSAAFCPQPDAQSDRSQLSISFPIAPSGFKSSTCSANNDKPTVSPLRLSHDFGATQMGIGIGIVTDEHKQRQANQLPIHWETSMGGPLGEVLHSNSNSSSECKNSSALKLLSQRWNSSPRLALSPTGVLQKATFCSLLSSSAGSSPRAETNRTGEGATLCLQ